MCTQRNIKQMINTTKIHDTVKQYEERCYRKHKAPTYYGLSKELGISKGTISNVVRGVYADGKPYTNKPHISRCIDNEDFKIIQRLYM